MEPVEPDKQVTTIAIDASGTRARASTRRRLRHHRGLPVWVAWSLPILEGLDPIHPEVVTASRSHPHHRYEEPVSGVNASRFDVEAVYRFAIDPSLKIGNIKPVVGSLEGVVLVPCGNRITP
jgi:hypothetical protein